MSDKKEIVETLKAAKSYLNHLENLNNQLKIAEKQIIESTSETKKNIEITFSTLLSNLTEILLNRKDVLIKRMREVCLKFLLGVLNNWDFFRQETRA